MKIPPYPENEIDRQYALDESGLLNNQIDERFDRITRIACQVFSMPIALVSLIDNDRQWFKSCLGLEASETPRNISFCGHAILSDKPLIVENALNDERFSDNPLVAGPPDIRFYAGIPLKTRTGLRLGTLCIIDQKPRTFSAENIRLLCDLGNTIEDLIGADADKRISNSSHEEALIDTERRAQLVVEGTGVGTWEWNIQTGETVFNERWAEIIGYTLTEITPVSIDTWIRFVHPEDLDKTDAVLKQHFSGQTEYYDCKARMLHKEGHWVWVRDRGQVFEWTSEGEPLRMYGTHADITNEIHAEQALKASRDELSSLISNMPGVTYRCLPDENWTLLYISNQIETLSGYKAEELLNNTEINYEDLIHPEDTQRASESINNAINNEENWHIEYRILHRDGDWRWVEERGRAIFDDISHVIVLEGFVVDITREHEAEAQLKKHHDALMLLNELALGTNETLEQAINHALEVAKDYLDMEVAIVSQIENSTYTVRWLSSRDKIAITSGSTFDLADTWCQLLFSGNEHELLIPNVQNSRFFKHPCYQHFPIASYIGIALEVEGNIFGTLNFSRSSNKESFDESEVIFVRLLARWLGGLLENNLSNERLTKLLEQLPGTVYQYRLYPDGHATFPFSSRNIEKLYGLSPSQAKESAQAAFDAIHPDDLDQISDSINLSANNLSYWEAIYRVRAADGRYRWISGQAKPEQLLDGSILWHGYIYDINEREQARQSLERNEARLRSLFDFSPIGIALNDYQTGQFIDLNSALLKPTGYTQEEFLQLSYWELTPKKYQEEEEKALFDMQESGRYGPFEKEYIRKDGSRYPVRLQGTLSTDPDGRKVIWSLIEDISERQRVEKMKDQFIATVSHELRTPLTAINGSISLLQGGIAGQPTLQGMSLLDNASRNGKRLAKLINDLLDMEKLVAGKMSMLLTVQAIGPLIDEAIDSMTNYGHQRNNLIVSQKTWPNINVKVDGARLIQAMNNLLSNAIKFSPEGEKVHVSAKATDQQLTIFVRDHGNGVPQEFQKQLFRRFSQGDSSDTRKMPGTGLGLAITREICHQLGGDVHYRDAKGGGSEFYITLPIKNN